MTKFIKIDAAVSLALLLAGTLFKVNHYPGANIILIVGVAAAVLALALMISSTLMHLKGFEKFNVIFSAFVLIIISIAFAFKLNHWPGAAKLIWIGDIAIILACVSFLIDTMMEKAVEKWNIKLIATFFILFLWLVAIYMR
jgi:hypothetical protein